MRHRPAGVIFRMVTALAAALTAASCGGMTPQATLTSLASGDPTQGYIGMSKSEVLSCAGAPYSRYASGGNETLVYRYNGAGPTPRAVKSDGKKKSSVFSSFKKSDSGDDWTCSASLVFESGRLARVNFAHKDVRSPYDWQGEDDPKKQEEMRNQAVPTCGFSLPNCRR